MQVNNKVVIITGAGSGIGAATARLFAQHQAKVIVSDIRMERAERVCQSIQEAGGTAMAISTNVAKFEEVQQLIDQTL
ncbi:MAG: SDR family NAD(P)-dependent oxidoreductase, partial [Bacteroidota bacterium]